MQSILSKTKKKAVIYLLPWIADIVISICPGSNKASRFIDRLILLSEEL